MVAEVFQKSPVKEPDCTQKRPADIVITHAQVDGIEVPVPANINTGGFGCVCGCGGEVYA